jgi:hypothetical protein
MFRAPKDLADKLQAGTLVMKPLGASGLQKYGAKDPLQLPHTLTAAECLHCVLSPPRARMGRDNKPPIAVRWNCRVLR